MYKEGGRNYCSSSTAALTACVHAALPALPSKLSLRCSHKRRCLLQTIVPFPRVESVCVRESRTCHHIHTYRQGHAQKFFLVCDDGDDATSFSLTTTAPFWLAYTPARACIRCIYTGSLSDRVCRHLERRGLPTKRAAPVERRVSSIFLFSSIRSSAPRANGGLPGLGRSPWALVHANGSGRPRHARPRAAADQRKQWQPSAAAAHHRQHHH